MAAGKKKTPTKQPKQGSVMQQQQISTKRSASSEAMPSIHPNYTGLEVKMTDGEIFHTRSTYHAPSIILDVDRKTHPAWTKQANYVDQKAGKVANFNNKYASLFSKKK